MSDWEFYLTWEPRTVFNDKGFFGRWGWYDESDEVNEADEADGLEDGHQ